MVVFYVMMKVLIVDGIGGTGSFGSGLSILGKRFGFAGLLFRHLMLDVEI